MTEQKPEDSFDQRIFEVLRQIKAPEEAKLHALEAIENARCAEKATDAATPIGHEAAAAFSVIAKEEPKRQGANPTDGALANATAANRPAARLASRRRRWPAALAAAACLLVAILGFSGWQLYQQPVAYVGLDINPSLELAVNRFDCVVTATAINDDGRTVLEQVSLVGMSYEEAFDCLMESEAMAPYLSDDSFVEVSITSQDDSLAEVLQAQSNSLLAHCTSQSACHRADEETRAAAAAAGMGVGRYRAAQELVELDDSLTLGDCAHMTMRELHDAIDHLCAEEGHGNGHGFGNGNGGRYDNDSDADENASDSQGRGQGNGNGTGSKSGNGGDTDENTPNGQGYGQGNGTGNGNGGNHGNGAGNGHGHGSGHHAE